MVEYFLAKEAVVGSNPITRSFYFDVMKILDLLKEKTSSCNKCSQICHLVSVVLISSIVAIIVNKIMIKSSVSKELKNNPKAIIDSVEGYYRNQQKKSQEEATKKAPKVAKNLEMTNPVLGNKNGSKVIVEFFDYACGHCKRQATEIHKVIQADKDVKVVLADLAIMSQHSLTAAQTGVYIALKNPSKLERYYIALSQKQISPDTIKQTLKTIGLPENYVSLASKDKNVETIMQQNFNAAREIGIQGTPALIIDGKFVGGMITAGDILAMLK